MGITVHLTCCVLGAALSNIRMHTYIIVLYCLNTRRQTVYRLNHNTHRILHRGLLQYLIIKRRKIRLSWRMVVGFQPAIRESTHLCTIRAPNRSAQPARASPSTTLAQKQDSCHTEDSLQLCDTMATLIYVGPTFSFSLGNT
jgi:hypothetical protein